MFNDWLNETNSFLIGMVDQMLQNPVKQFCAFNNRTISIQRIIYIFNERIILIQQIIYIFTERIVLIQRIIYMFN